MASGGRHRSQYFQEITNVLDENNHQEGYLKNFCENLHNKKYSNLSVKNLVNLVGNLSNLELKPLRKYFNDKNLIIGMSKSLQKLIATGY